MSRYEAAPRTPPSRFGPAEQGVLLRAAAEGEKERERVEKKDGKSGSTIANTVRLSAAARSSVGDRG